MSDRDHAAFEAGQAFGFFARAIAWLYPQVFQASAWKMMTNNLSSAEWHADKALALLDVRPPDPLVDSLLEERTYDHDRDTRENT